MQLKPGFKAGDLVRIKPEWDGDDRVYRVVEWNGDRGYIKPINWHSPIIPAEVVRESMITLVSEESEGV